VPDLLEGIGDALPGGCETADFLLGLPETGDRLPPVVDAFSVVVCAPQEGLHPDVVRPPETLDELAALAHVAEHSGDQAPRVVVEDAAGELREVVGGQRVVHRPGHRPGSGDLGGDVLGCVVGGGREHDLEPGQRGPHPAHANLVARSQLDFLQHVGEGIEWIVELGEHPRPLDDQTRQYVTEHRRLARTGRTVDREDARLVAELAEDLVDGELLAHDQGPLGTCRPAPTR
jgi:hypothetical protein